MAWWGVSWGPWCGAEDDAVGVDDGDTVVVELDVDDLAGSGASDADQVAADGDDPGAVDVAFGLS